MVSVAVLPTRAVILRTVFEMDIVLIIDKKSRLKMNSQSVKSLASPPPKKEKNLLASNDTAHTWLFNMAWQILMNDASNPENFCEHLWLLKFIFYLVHAIYFVYASFVQVIFVANYNQV